MVSLSHLTAMNIHVGSLRFLNLFSAAIVSDFACKTKKLTANEENYRSENPYNICFAILTTARCKLSPPISTLIFLRFPTMPMHGPHHSEYTSTTGIKGGH